jgi:hypothetical protein
MTAYKGRFMETFLSDSHRVGKQINAIRSLPDEPSKHIYWIVYNKDMVKYTEALIEQIKGKEYMTNISVVSKNDSTKDRTKGSIYFDPTLMDLIGNGGYG